MQNTAAIRALGALAQTTRLDAFRLLVRKEPAGLPATMIAKSLNVANNTMSLHLGVLVTAGLVGRVRKGKYLIYRANIAAFSDLMLFLVKDCCQSAPQLSEPLLTQITGFCIDRDAVAGT